MGHCAYGLRTYPSNIMTVHWRYVVNTPCTQSRSTGKQTSKSKMPVLLVILFEKAALVLIYEKVKLGNKYKRISLPNCPYARTRGDQIWVQTDEQHCSGQHISLLKHLNRRRLNLGTYIHSWTRFYNQFFLPTLTRSSDKLSSITQN